ncbi:putative MFS family arabinose efflux permease [Dokdonia sp. Hel_I_63]|uniref:MDR family MFS transporter n=1 Tax=Dokdonia sp. Hel_I_63 TaxID=1249996 RepID=UPI00119BB862|nr:MFS transporter [Dokdonia sp. Hel_I_63]TVZ23304.1 putative MFS family arabinose efflux permease [Dokdonia sp. Hel_I_63]
MKTLLRNYTNTFKGLSREIWWLSLITLINRAGAMVIPFLSIYLNKDLHFSLPDVAWIMTSYGLGSFAGAWLGGKLCDVIGYYKVILLSLIFTGINFLWVMHVETFWVMCFSFFILMVLADMGRPAFFVALSAYSKPENKTRSLTLIRLAINLGFSVGPAVGGILIATAGYDALFYVDGLTCLFAAILMTQVLNPKKTKELDKEVMIENPKKPLLDAPYVLFLVALALFGIVFVQYFSTVPLYYKDEYKLGEDAIGLILALNGILIVLFEMPLIAWMEKKNLSNVQSTILGLLMTGASFVLLLWETWVGIIVIGMIIATFGEMISFPFSNKFALDRSKLGRQGAYMGVYSMSFSVAHIFGHNSGMQITEAFGFQTTWIFLIGLTLIAWLLLYIVKRMLANETPPEPVSLTSK